MSVAHAFDRLRRVFTHLDFIDLELVSQEWSRFGIVRASMDWFCDAFLADDIQDQAVTLIFVNDSESEAVACECSVGEIRARLEQHKYYGYAFLVIDQSLGMYYETIEGLGFVCVSDFWGEKLKSQRAGVEQATGYLEAEMAAIEDFNDCSRAYAEKMRRLVKNSEK